MEASTSKDPPSPANTIHPTSPVRAASLPPIYVGDIPIITFENPLEDVIGEHNEAYFDSQEYLEEGRESSFEVLKEGEIFEGEYAFHEDMILEELWWPAKMLDNVNSLYSKKDSCGNTVSVIMGVWSGPKLILSLRSLYQGHYYLLYFLKFPLKWEIKKNIIIYIRVSTSIITFAVQYFLFIVFHNVFYTIPIIEFPLKWEIQNNIMIYILMS